MAKNRSGGRPSKWTPELQQGLCEAISGGLPIQVAATMHGIHKDTLYEWMKTRTGFSDAIKQALATGEARCVAVLHFALAANAHGVAMWMLQNHPEYRKRWRSRDGVQSPPKI